MQKQSEKTIVKDLSAECTVIELCFRSILLLCICGHRHQKMSDKQDRGRRLEELGADQVVLHLGEFQEGEMALSEAVSRRESHVSISTGITQL